MYKVHNKLFNQYILKIIFRSLLLTFLLVAAVKSIAQQPFNPKNGNWTKGLPERFKGEVWIEYFINDTINDFVSSRVFFQPSSRSNWHKHLGKQIIFAIDGEGFYKEKGKPITTLKKGDVVIIEPGTIHCHGSRSHSFMQGVTMNGIGKKESTIWLNHVSEEEL